ncbi:sulfotransferase [Nocardioidaceae bacterium SCSIO 66511]|nr:sulfotransferase [Nocardioidaceae bacterium SCSIO 66511]
MLTEDVERLRAELEHSRQRRRKLRKQVDRLNRSLERAEQELVAASAQKRHDEAELDYVFILTYGRSGSTLLQGILSSTPGWLVRGENGDAMRPLFDFHRESVLMREARLEAEMRDTADPWFGMDEFPTAPSLRQIRELALATILRPEPGCRVVGFKEIRWWQHDDLPQYLDFFRDVFPGARFVVNTRRLEDVAKSKWWARLPDPIAELSKHEERILAAHEHLGDSSHHVRYDDYVSDPRTLEPLFEWLGESYDDRTVRSVLQRRHSY